MRIQSVLAPVACMAAAFFLGRRTSNPQNFPAGKIPTAGKPDALVRFKRSGSDVHVPEYATPGSACVDLSAYISEPVTLAPGQTAKLPTGLAIELPSKDYVALMYPRSGISVRHGITLVNSVGVIDSDYRGEMAVPVINLGKEPYTIQPGERIAQLCIAPVRHVRWSEAEALSPTSRGAGGFGSTGK